MAHQSPDYMIRIWKRGFWLGLLLIGFFIVGAALAYFGVGLIGWSGAGQAMIALLLGPILGGIGFGVFWRIKRSALLLPVEENAEVEAKAAGEAVDPIETES